MTSFLEDWSHLLKANLMAVFSVASGSSVAGRSSARISSGLRGSFRGGFCSLLLIPIPAVMAFHKALWDFEPKWVKKNYKRSLLCRSDTVPYIILSFDWVYLVFCSQTKPSHLYWPFSKGSCNAAPLRTNVVIVLFKVTRCQAGTCFVFVFFVFCLII